MTEHHADEALALLREELAGVSAPPDFAARVQHRISEGADLLHDELAAVAVSPEFKVRVRQQVDAAQQARASSWLGGWRWLVPVAAAASIALIVALGWLGAPSTPAPVVTTAANPTPDVRTPVPPPSPSPRTAAPAVASPLRHERTGVRRSTGEPSMEVITNQPAILRALAARIGPNARVVETTSVPVPETAPEIVVPTLEVSPLVVKPLGEPPVIGGGSSIIR
jgi:hypothetical protein